MTHERPENRDETVQQIRKEYSRFFDLLWRFGIFLVAVIIALLLNEMGSNFIQNLIPEALSIIVTILFIDYLNERRAERLFKQQLIMDAGSKSNDKALDAIHQIERRGWLYGENGLLKARYLRSANLQNANLSHVNLQGSFLADANLQNATLFHTNLSFTNLHQADLFSARLLSATLYSANLSMTNLQNVLLQETNLELAQLGRANLRGAILWKANMKGSNLEYAYLREANLSEAEFDKNTILPDGEIWTPDTDMSRFTDPNHPEFWQPDWVKDE